MLAPDLIVPQPAPKLPGEKGSGPVKYVEINSRDPQRVCDPCYDAVAVFQEELSSRECNALQQGAELDEESMVRFMNSPVSFSLEQEIKKAAYTISNITYKGGLIKDKSIPLPLLHKAKGLAVRILRIFVHCGSLVLCVSFSQCSKQALFSVVVLELA